MSEEPGRFEGLSAGCGNALLREFRDQRLEISKNNNPDF
jgi:hypothetical protein